jgi:Resolvase, N terminal domain
MHIWRSAMCSNINSAIEGQEINGFGRADIGCRMIIGYARVSTDGQTLDAQQAALRAAGAEKVYAEKISGTVTDRKALAKAIATLNAGDTLLICRLDRLARSTRDLLNVLASASEKGAGFRSLADPMIDTTSPHGKLIFAVLGVGGIRAEYDPVADCGWSEAGDGQRRQIRTAT